MPYENIGTYSDDAAGSFFNFITNSNGNGILDKTLGTSWFWVFLAGLILFLVVTWPFRKANEVIG